MGNNNSLRKGPALAVPRAQLIPVACTCGSVEWRERVGAKLFCDKLGTGDNVIAEAFQRLECGSCAKGFNSESFKASFLEGTCDCAVADGVKHVHGNRF